MPNKWMEEEIRLAQQNVDETVVKNGTGPFPVYRPSKGEVVWVPSIDDVVFVALAEQFLTKSQTLLEEDERMARLGPIRRLLYRGSGK